MSDKIELLEDLSSLLQDEMEITEMEVDKIISNCDTNEYLQRLLNISDLKLLKEVTVRNAFQERGALWTLSLVHDQIFLVKIAKMEHCR